MPVSNLRREVGALLRLAAPIAAAQAGTQLMGLVDVAVLGRYGARELAGAGLGNAIFFAVSIVGMGIVLGIDPLIAQAVGAGDRPRARRVLWQGVWVALTLTIALTLLLVAAAHAIPLAGVQPELVAPAQTFLLIRAITIAPYLLYYVSRSYLQAHAHVRPMVLSTVIANVVNFLGDLLLVFGGASLPSWTGPLRRVPEMGVAGAAWATVVCSFLQLAIIGAAVLRVPTGTSDGAHVDHRWNRNEVAQVFRVGLPIGLQMGAEIGIFALVGVLAARLGTLHLAAHQLTLALASFTYVVAMGVSAAGSVRVGLAIGARDAAATRRAGAAALIGGGAFMTCAALAFALAPRALARLITDQPDVIGAAIPLMFVAAVFQISDGIQGVAAGILRGAGDTRFALYANLVGHWLIGLPIALVLGFHEHLGIIGLWWGLCAGLTFVAAVLFARFERLSRSTIVPL
ncbi:MAG TPA: MATE family efflux transporter [Thermoanaerobaculia bacterium]|jgi:MATE family multidrug resistance protein